MINFFKRFFGAGNCGAIHAYGITDTGQRRDNNEDCFLIRQERRIFIVADGMGGHNAGEVASAEAVKALDEFFTSDVVVRMDKDPSSIESLMVDAFHQVNSHVYTIACQNLDYKGMGCTLIMAYLCGEVLHLCHVGDVRGYLIGASGIRQLTNDHTEVAEMVRDGAMTAEEARTSKLKNYLTQAVGQLSALVPEYYTCQLGDDECVLLCSDGLWDMLSDAEIQAIFKKNKKIEDICKQLITEANDAGGHDNVTVVVFKRHTGENK